ncbi:hypothetical protein FB468_2055 [Leucobacter komagatae]|uniref:Uncharacterized protein n=1 Tax=Leucobacter komagatae TaxID=55969 RepID=A0A542Y7M9_9MICO|nr:hypothetical protein [Leucobacter komagatae]TQL44017.1 hypothetical protein FB468_2055 [Leucobacter komagatae]
MAYDNKGIYKYTEADDAVTMSALLNLGQDSVSNTLKYFADTSAKRMALVPPPPGAMWQDTDNGERLWSVGPDGAWRLHEGRVSVIAGAWATSQTPFFGRTITWDLPTVLAPTETLMVTQDEGSGTGFSAASLASITRYTDKTQITVRHLAFASNVTQPLSITWRIVKRAV